jgi:hypothetical protein
MARKKAAFVLPTESRAELEEERSEVARAINPRNRIEQIYSDDFAYANWELERYRRAKSSMVKRALPEVLYEILVDLSASEPKEALALVEQWNRGEPDARARVSAILGEHGLEEQDVEGEAVLKCLPDLLTGEQLSASAVLRRDKALAGIAFVREMEAQQVQQANKAVLEKSAMARVEPVPGLPRPVKHGH